MKTRLRQRALRPRVIAIAARLYLLATLILLTACSSGHIEANGPAIIGPLEVVTYVGNGERVAGSVGPKGGQYSLSKDGFTLVIPPDAVGSDGRAMMIRKDEGPGLPASAGIEAVGPLLLISPSLDLATGKSVTLSLPLPELPSGHTEAELSVAVEKPGSVGPADGTSSPATSWDYVHVDWKDKKAVAVLPKLWGGRLQFVFRRDANSSTGGRQ